MNLLSVKDLSKMGREAPLFENVTFGLNEGEKAALIGRNGTGKSTLLQCIAGNIYADNGTAIFNNDAGVSFLPQNPVYNPEHTIREHIFSGTSVAGQQVTATKNAPLSTSSAKLTIIREYERLCDEMSNNATATELSVAEKKQFEIVSALMSEKDLWTYEAEIKSILTTLGITAGKDGKGLDRKMKELSGGMIKKVVLAQVLVEDTKLLLLDEPTNHLDITTIAWLEDYLKNTSRSVLMVTHDRYFLDSVCTDIYELERGKFNHYKGNFSIYLEKKATEMEIAENTERRIESVLRTERDWLMRGPCARGTKARARVDNIHRLINRDKLQKDQGFQFEVSGRRLGGKILELHRISKGFKKGNASTVSISADNKTNAGSSSSTSASVLDNFSYIFKKGERIGVFGDNGTGKSTLLNIVTGNLEPDSGEVIKGINTAFGYYQQNPVFENTAMTVLEYIKEAAEFVTTNEGKTLSASQMLEQFGFEGKIQYSQVSTLSGGERKRLFLVRLLMTNPNFLVLDEPTNDFDIFTMSILESFLQGFGGCILVVSHDRYFMDKIADTLFILENDGSVSGYTGKCSDYIDYRRECLKEADLEAKNAAQLAKEKAANVTTPQNNDEKKQDDTSNAQSVNKARRRTFKEQKEFDTIENSIFEAEARKEELEALMAGGETDHSKLGDISKEYSTVTENLEKLYARWEELGSLTEY